MQCNYLLLSLNSNRATKIFNDIIYHTEARKLRHNLLVNDVEPQPVPGSLDLGDQVSDLLDAVHLLGQVFRLQKVTQVGVTKVGGHLVDIQKTLVHL